MKKLSLFISMVLVSFVIGGRAMAQTTTSLAPTRTSDPSPHVTTKAVINLPLKNSGGAATTAAARPLSQADLRAKLPLKPGGPASTGAGTPAANRALPLSRPAVQPGSAASATSGTSFAPVKSSGSGGTPPNPGSSGPKQN